MSVTLEQELAALEKKTATERAALQTKHAILAKLPPLEGYAPPFVHIHELYGSVGSMNFSTQRYASIAKGKSPDANLLRLLLAAAPPVELIKIKAGCTSIQPEPETYESNGECCDIDPVIIRIEPSQHSSQMKVEWYGQLGEELWRMSVEFPLHNPKLGTLSLRFRYSHDMIVGVDYCDYKPADSNANRIKWASGSQTDPGSFTVYWERGHNVDIPALFEVSK